MVTPLSIAVAALLLMVVFFATWAVNLRARAFKQAEEIRRLRSASKTPEAPSSGDDTKRLEEKAPSVIAEYDDNIEIPAELRDQVAVVTAARDRVDVRQRLRIAHQRLACLVVLNL